MSTYHNGQMLANAGPRAMVRVLVIAIVLGLLAAWGLGSVKAQGAPPPQTYQEWMVQHDAYGEGTGMAHGHHPAKDMALHEQFYSKWERPNLRRPDGSRHSSCCNNEDCFPTPVRQRGSVYEALSRDKTHWVQVPPHLLEENQPDPVESPDGQSHACIGSMDYVYCAVRGTGQ